MTTAGASYYCHFIVCLESQNGWLILAILIDVYSFYSKEAYVFNNITIGWLLGLTKLFLLRLYRNLWRILEKLTKDFCSKLF